MGPESSRGESFPQAEQFPEEQINQTIEQLFAINPDAKKEMLDFGKALFAAKKNLEREKENGESLQVGETIQDTFQNNEINELTRKGYIYFIPQNQDGKLICLSDCHGSKTAFTDSLKEFFQNSNSYLVITGDLVSAFGENEYELLKAVLKLKADSQTAKRVVWLRGNCETHVWPMEVTEKNTIYDRFGFKADVVFRHEGLEPILRKLLPVAAVSENGVYFIHGTPQNLSLIEINQCADYKPDSSGPYGNVRDGSRSIFNMLEGDISDKVSKTRAGIVSSTMEEIVQNMKKVDANLLVRGHQKKRLVELAGGSCLIETQNNKQVATIHSGRFEKQGGDTYLVLPNQKFGEITPNMIKKV